MKKLWIALLLVLSGSLWAQDKTDLPVTRVVLFSSGVAFFEHNGTVTGTTLARLPFKTEQINDVLKSMVLRDNDGGTVAAVTYASQDPLDRALRSFAVDLSAQPGLSQLLGQVRGAEVTVQAAQLITGKILGLEAVQKPAPGNGPVTVYNEILLNLVTAEGLRSVPMSTVVSVKLTDARLNDEIQKALALLATSADTSRKAVDIQFTGQGKRRVAVGYITEAPVWKTSYRLDLTGEKPFLQGWAIVENTSDADWTNVNLALVSGQPISFIQDLYTPQYIRRPVVARPEVANVGPQLYDDGFAPAAEMAAAPPPAPMMAPAPSMAASGRTMAADQPGGPGEYRQMSTDLRSSGVTTAAVGSAAGELFRFSVKTPVSLARRQSAMLPLVNGEIKAERVSIYNASVLASHPLNGAWITNSTGLRLLGGPVTVFDEGMYAGDALFDNLGENDRKLVSFGVDLSSPVLTEPSSATAITKISIIKGVLTIVRLNTFSQTYKLQNKSDRAKTLIIEHPVTGGRNLVEPKTFEEQTAGVTRFRVSVPKNSSQEFVVREQQPVSETVALLNTRSPNFLVYQSYGETSKAVRDSLQKAADLRTAWETLTVKIADLQKQKSEIEGGQARLRANIETVGRDTQQGNRYLQKLSADEDKLDELAKAIEKNRAEADKAQKAFEEFVRTLSVE